MIVVKCPRCRASGGDEDVVIQDGYGVCSSCNTTWKRGDLGQMIAVDPE